ncbi:GNAT family N-acetyltransferase [Flavobacterium sp.]|uniref:GNAT family N-acetyltransferase n=1 Tax=Flavobacterium sp. TaxID=239 RepID=UPI002602272C|nr:GNAT family N-acetyltransferase [Flavobacterium sp.]
MQIRPVRTSDVPEVVAIVNYEIENSTSIYEEQTRSVEAQQELISSITDAGFPFLVAEIDNRVAGFACYGTFRKKYGYRNTVEHSVYVSNDFRGKQVGSSLLQALIDYAKKQQLHVLVACIDTQNPKSIAFHEKFGFKQTAILPRIAEKKGKILDLAILQLDLRLD